MSKKNVSAVAAILAEHPSWGARKIAAKLRAKPSTVQGWMAQLDTPAPEPSFKTDLEATGNQAWKDRYGDLQKKYAKALKHVSATELLIEEIRSVAPLSYSPAPAIIRDRKRREVTNAPQSAVLLFSDTHVGKVVTPEQTLGHGNYNFEIFLNRLKYLEESVLSITEDHHSKTPCPELVICMLGDMLDGALSHANEADQHHTLFTQFYGAGHAIAQFFRHLAAHFPKIRIQTAVGNHTRWGTQRKMPTVNRFSNLDMFLYALVRALVTDIKNIEFTLKAQPFTEFDVHGYRFHGSHGDHVRGGDKALGIPNHSIARQISATTQLAAKRADEARRKGLSGTSIAAPHYYVLGHLHRSITLPHALGSVIVNGGFPGVDNYGLMEGFSPVDPVQRFFFIHPKYGKTAEYPIDLKNASDIGGKRPYVIPGGFGL